MNVAKFDIVSLLRKMISEMQIKVKVKSFVDNSDGSFTITTCNKQYLNECSIFTVNDNDYVVMSMDEDSLTVQGSPVLESDFILPAPLFIPDTPQGTNIELGERSSQIDRHPFIWLLENFPTKFSNKGRNVSEPRVRLFFLNGSDNDKWLEGTHRENSIDPMHRLIDSFLKELKAKVSGKTDEFTVVNRLRFGKTDGKKLILNESLSGVELDITIGVKQWAVKCKDC